MKLENLFDSNTAVSSRKRDGNIYQLE